MPPSTSVFQEESRELRGAAFLLRGELSTTPEAPWAPRVLHASCNLFMYLITGLSSFSFQFCLFNLKHWFFFVPFCKQRLVMYPRLLELTVQPRLTSNLQLYSSFNLPTTGIIDRYHRPPTTLFYWLLISQQSSLDCKYCHSSTVDGWLLLALNIARQPTE